MIKVTMELVSAIGRGRDKVLGVAKISNDGQETMFKGDPLGSYEVSLSKWAPKLEEAWRKGKVAKFDRVGRGPWDLLYRCLRTLIAVRNPDPLDPRRNPPQLRLWCNRCHQLGWAKATIALDGTTSIPTGYVYDCLKCGNYVGDDGGIWREESPDAELPAPPEGA